MDSPCFPCFGDSLESLLPPNRSHTMIFPCKTNMFSNAFLNGRTKTGVRLFSATSTLNTDDAMNFDFDTINKVVWGKECASSARRVCHALAPPHTHTCRTLPSPFCLKNRMLERRQIGVTRDSCPVVRPFGVSFGAPFGAPSGKTLKNKTLGGPPQKAFSRHFSQTDRGGGRPVV